MGVMDMDSEECGLKELWLRYEFTMTRKMACYCSFNDYVSSNLTCFI
jgi:hypothetical protein